MKIMKKSFTFFAAVAMMLLLACETYADDRPVDFKKLPVAAQTFINANYSGVAVLYSVKDDDLVLPDYTVMLKNGVKLQFSNGGELESIKVQEGSVPAGIVPVQITDYVKAAYPDVLIKEYDVDRNSHEVKLSNRLEIKFNRAFQVVEIDD
jgi:hypothetical protein